MKEFIMFYGGIFQRNPDSVSLYFPSIQECIQDVLQNGIFLIPKRWIPPAQIGQIWEVE